MNKCFCEGFFVIKGIFEGKGKCLVYYILLLLLIFHSIKIFYVRFNFKWVCSFGLSFYFQKHLGISPKSGRKYSSDRRNHGGNRETVWLKLSPWPHPRPFPPSVTKIDELLLLWCILTVILWWENILLSFYVFPETQTKGPSTFILIMRRFTTSISLVHTIFKHHEFYSL